MRVGEARVPGPEACNEWTLGVCNPSGLQGKSHVLNGVQADVLALSETHLTASAKRHLTTSLRSMGSRFRHVLTGAPMAPRSLSSDAGAWAGVGFASAVPCRTVATPWPPDLYETGRLQFAAFHTRDSWTFGAVVYGFPEGKTHPHALSRTEALLDFAMQRLSMTPGPRFLAGDFNFEPDTLSATQSLRAQGWVEVQDLHHARTGAAIVNTCKGVTRKDHLWLSPELALAFRTLFVCDDHFADHAVLHAVFAGGTSHLERFVWPCPKEVAWKHVTALSEPMSFLAPADPTDQYAALWRTKESQAQLDLPHVWMPAMAGRGQQLKPQKKCSRGAPLRNGRTHDVQPAFFGFSVQHARQFKQLRRLQNYCRWVDQHHPAHGHVRLHGIGLWNSILKAPGFVPTFAEWWESRQYVCPLDPLHMPQFCPEPSVAHLIYDAVYAEVRLLERNLLAAKKSHRRHQHEADRHLIFRDVARTPAAPVESLLHSVKAEIASVDEDECAVVLTQAVNLRADLPLWIAGDSVEVVHAEQDKIWLGDVQGLDSGQAVTQTQFLGDLPALFQAFHDQWKQRWCRHDHTPFSRWDTILDFAKHVLRPCIIPHLQVDAAGMIGFKRMWLPWTASVPFLQEQKVTAPGHPNC